jgi:nuclear factor erythroid 2, invertebrate
MLDANRQPVAQKKHQMYGKRFAHESSVLPPPSLHPHSSIGADLTSIPNVPLKYEPYEPYAVASNNLDGAAAASSSSVIKPPSSMMDSEMKYSYSIDFPHNRHLKSGGNGLASHELINHNHTYTMPHPGPLNSNGATPRPQTRDKKSKKSEDEHLTRDEKRARALHIPISVSFPVSIEGFRE